MTPETRSALRSLLIAVGMFGVAKGWYDKEELETIVSNLIGFGGAALTLFAAAWGIWSKRSSSKEAQVIAGRVIADPNARAITPPPKESP
jgi:hypothetical protein